MFLSTFFYMQASLSYLQIICVTWKKWYQNWNHFDDSLKWWLIFPKLNGWWSRSDLATFQPIFTCVFREIIGKSQAIQILRNICHPKPKFQWTNQLCLGKSGESGFLEICWKISFFESTDTYSIQFLLLEYYMELRFGSRILIKMLFPRLKDSTWRI